MKKLLLLLITASLLSFASKPINKRGIVLVHYNAEFNASNNYTDIGKIKDAKIYEASIDGNAELQASEAIRSVPTLVLYKNGKEIKRWEAGLSLSLQNVDYREIQKEVDQLTGANKF